MLEAAEFTSVAADNWKPHGITHHRRMHWALAQTAAVRKSTGNLAWRDVVSLEHRKLASSALCRCVWINSRRSHGLGGLEGRHGHALSRARSVRARTRSHSSPRRMHYWLSISALIVAECCTSFDLGRSSFPTKLHFVSGLF
eukprot:6198329-Pleurochrysis_carterae.AAC.1